MKLKTSAAAAALLAGVLCAQSAAAQTYDRLVVFGDSLSDSGNTFRASRGTNPPSPPYFQGRFSNGPTFAEQLGFAPLTLFGTTTGNVNNAFGGAETLGPGNFGVPSIRQQVEGYLAFGGRFGARDLVSLLGGANNILNAFPAVGGAANPVAAMSAIATGAANDIGQITRRIAGAGAGTVLVSNLPDIGATPAFNTGPGSPLATLGTQTFNGVLRANLNAAAAANAGSNIILVDIGRFDAHVRSRPGEFGFTNVTQACLTTTVCATPDSFYYWDGVHPTAATSRLFAGVVLDYAYYGSRGAATAALGETALEHRGDAQDAALDRLDGAEEGEGVRFALALEGGRSDQGERGDVPQIERDTAAVRVSVDGKLQPDLTLGLIFSGAQSDVQAGALQFQGASYGADLYFGFGRGPAFANLVLGASADEYDDHARATGVGSISHHAGRVRGSSYGAKLQAGVRLPMGGGTLSPRAALSGIHTEVEAFEEDGPAARHAVSEHQIEAVLGEASVRFETPLGARLTGHAEAGYGAFFSYDGDVEVGLVDNTARRLGTEVDDPGQGFLLDLGVQGQVLGHVQLGVAYRGRFDEDSDSHAALLTLAVRR